MIPPECRAVTDRQSPRVGPVLDITDQTHMYPSYPKDARSLGEQVQPCICTLHLMIHLYTLSKYIIEFFNYLFFETCSTV